MIHTNGLSKQFRVGKRTVEAVRGLDLTIGAGELVALLGPNGAGKSTTLRMLTTLLAPTRGTAVVAGYDIRRRPAAVRRAIGYIGQGNGAGHNQRGRDELVTQGRVYGLTRAAAARRATELIDSLGLAEVADRPVVQLSGGQRRRLDIAMGLVHAPGLLFLDEPSTGLDPQNRANLHAHIRDLHARHGTTMVLTTHYLEEADGLADRVVVVDHGRVVADDTPERLKSELAGDRVRLELTDPNAAAAAESVVLRADARAAVQRQHSRLDLRVVDGARLLPRLLAELAGANLTVVSAEAARPTLDDVFLGLTGRSLREDNAVGAEPPTAQHQNDQHQTDQLEEVSA